VKERRWKDDEAILAAKVGMRLRGAGAGCIMYPGTALCLGCCGWCGRRSSEAETHDHKGPTATQTLAPSKYMA
jgi:hypothetical protein